MGLQIKDKAASLSFTQRSSGFGYVDNKSGFGTEDPGSMSHLYIILGFLSPTPLDLAYQLFVAHHRAS